MQTPEAAIDLDKRSMGFDQVRERKETALRCCSLVNFINTKKFTIIIIRLLFYLQQKYFNLRIKFVADPKNINYLMEKVVFRIDFQLM